MTGDLHSCSRCYKNTKSMPNICLRVLHLTGCDETPANMAKPLISKLSAECRVSLVVRSSDLDPAQDAPEKI
jgi:hypothetical protein